MREIDILLIVIALTQVGDVITTYLCLSRKLGREGNPVMAKIFDKVGMLPGLILVKGAFMVFILWAAPLMHVYGLYFIAAITAAVVVNNLRVLHK